MAEKEYIDTAQLFKCETCYHMGGDGKCNSYCDAGESYRPAFSKLKTADVVEVVRCKDCKMFYKCIDGTCLCCHSSGLVGDITEDSFCSYGKRREGDNQ